MSSCVPTTKGRSVLGVFALAFGRFPPVRVKVPAVIAAKENPVKKISKEEARNMIVKCRKRVNDMAPLIHDAPLIIASNIRASVCSTLRSGINLY